MRIGAFKTVSKVFWSFKIAVAVNFRLNAHWGDWTPIDWHRSYLAGVERNRSNSKPKITAGSMSPRRSRGSKASRPALKARWGARDRLSIPPSLHGRVLKNWKKLKWCRVDPVGIARAVPGFLGKVGKVPPIGPCKGYLTYDFIPFLRICKVNHPTLIHSHPESQIRLLFWCWLIFSWLPVIHHQGQNAWFQNCTYAIPILSHLICPKTPLVQSRYHADEEREREIYIYIVIYIFNFIYTCILYIHIIFIIYIYTYNI